MHIVVNSGIGIAFNRKGFQEVAIQTVISVIFIIYYIIYVQYIPYYIYCLHFVLYLC